MSSDCHFSYYLRNKTHKTVYNLFLFTRESETSRSEKKNILAKNKQIKKTLQAILLTKTTGQNVKTQSTYRKTNITQKNYIQFSRLESSFVFEEQQLWDP